MEGRGPRAPARKACVTVTLSYLRDCRQLAKSQAREQASMSCLAFNRMVDLAGIPPAMVGSVPRYVSVSITMRAERVVRLAVAALQLAVEANPIDRSEMLPAAGKLCVTPATPSTLSRFTTLAAILEAYGT